jgi:hypothetical protein
MAARILQQPPQGLARGPQFGLREEQPSSGTTQGGQSVAIVISRLAVRR